MGNTFGKKKSGDDRKFEGQKLEAKPKNVAYEKSEKLIPVGQDD